MSGRPRGWPARTGVTLLNLLAPGVGLLRVGKLRLAAIAYLAVVGAFLFLIAVESTTEDISFLVYSIVVALVLAAFLTAYAVSLWWTWRHSVEVIEPRPMWSCWYSILIAIFLSIAVSWVLTSISKTRYHNFYVPSEAMEPTLDTNDKFVASMRRPTDLRRGDILLVKAPSGATYIKRLAALPSDKIALRDGVVFINGVAAATMPAGSRRVSYPYKDVTEAKLYMEQFLGETRPHLIQDLGDTPLDNFPEITLDTSHVFMLGDNRDDSADSRVSKDEGGLELVPVANVIGRPLFFYWPRAKMSESIRNGGP